MDISLEKIELVRERTGASYAEAKEALEAKDGNVVDAIVEIEEKIVVTNDSGRLSKEEIINSEEKEKIIRIAKDIYYPKRTYANIFSKVDMDSDKKSKLIDFIVKTKDIKYLDAVDVLKYIKSLK